MNTLQPARLFVACIILTLCDGVTLDGADQPRPAAEKSLSLDLRSDYRPVPVRVPTPRDPLEVRSVDIRAQLGEDGTGEGSMTLDTRPATLNPLGDVTTRQGAQPKPIPIKIRRVTPDEILTLRDRLAPDPGLPIWRSLYAVEFPGNQVTATVRLKLSSIEFPTHRLLIYTTQPALSRRVDSGAPQVLTLTGRPEARSPLPDKPWSTQVSLSGTYNAPDGAYRRIGLEGSPGGQGRLSLDPNYITVNALGEPGMSTLIGFSPHPVTLNLVEAADPSDLERRLYQVVSDNPRDTNRCFLVLGKTEAAAHRLLLYQGHDVRLIVPMANPGRRRHETVPAGPGQVSAPEAQAIAEFREFMAYDFTYDAAQGKVMRLNVSGDVELSRLNAGLAKLTHLEEITLQGRFTAPGLPSLRNLPQLRRLSFSGVRLQPEAMASLQNLEQLESLSFYRCPGLDDAGLRHLTGLTRLRSLRLYDDPARAGSLADPPPLTDRGLATIAHLRTLESLDLFGAGITDVAFGPLSALTNLSRLHLHGTGVTVPALIRFVARSPETQVRASFFDGTSELGGFEITLDYRTQSAALSGEIDETVLGELTAWPTLEHLSLDAMTQVTDDGVRHIATFKNLEHLRMHNGHRLTDGALKHLQSLAHLKHLSLFACAKITDAGVVQLAPLSALESLELGQTGVTDQGVALLRERLPNCVIKIKP